MTVNSNRILSAKKRAQSVIESAENERRKKLFEYRLETAQKGIEAYQKKNIAEAVCYYKLYLKILEEYKEVPAGTLQPSHFSPGDESKELLLLSGIYWDLVKIFDKIKKEDKKKHFQHYMEKFVLFSHKMPFERLCAENVRKYIALGKAQHTTEFKNTYRLLGGGKNCFIVSVLIHEIDVQTLDILWCAKDKLKKYYVGQFFLAFYYFIGPFVAFLLKSTPHFFKKKIADCLVYLTYRFIQPFFKIEPEAENSLDKVD